MPQITKRQLLLKRWGALDKEFTSWVPVLREIADFFAPRRYRYMRTDANRGTWKHNRIYDNTGLLAVDIIRAGMMSGHASPWRPWFRLGHPDPDLNERANVKTWLYQVTDRMRRVFQESNFYSGLSVLYADQPVFGQAPVGLFEDFESVLRAETYAPASYRISTNARGIVDTFMHQRQMTVRSLVEKYGGYRAKSGSPDWSRFSSAVKTAYDNGNHENWVDVLWAVYPNTDYNPDALLDPRRKRYASCHIEMGAREDVFLRESGFDYFPVLCPRWNVTGEDAYGYGPGWEALGDNKALQTLHRRVMQADDKTVNPPLQAPVGLRKAGGVWQTPGHVTWRAANDMGQKVERLYDFTFDTRSSSERIAEHQARINRAFFVDLFRATIDLGKSDTTAREIAERHEEKFWILGPTLERDNDEFFDPAIDVTFEIMRRQGLLPEPPEELQGEKLVVQYTSIMAQAQAMVTLGATDRFLGMVGNVATVVPEALDKVDVDAVVDEYADVTGVNPKIVRSTDNALVIRQQRQQQQAADEALARAQMAAEGAKTLSETNTQDDNALTQLLGS